MSRYNRHSTVAPYLRKVRRHKSPYLIDVRGIPIWVLPRVMSPKYDWTSGFTLDVLPSQARKRVLEIGSGCGVLACACALDGATEVVATDISPIAVENTLLNLCLLGQSKRTTVIQSDVFANVTGRYDTVIFAAPYHGTKPRSWLEYGVSDSRYRALRSFLTRARGFLRPRGRIYLGFSDVGDEALLNRLLRQARLVRRALWQRRAHGFTAMLIELSPSSYAQKPNSPCTGPSLLRSYRSAV
ncbi:MAG: hypothetical protein C0497_06400 [Gemmatimonas sp.]|nr:hypothetical protein [Gemmatimonas sp.]